MLVTYKKIIVARKFIKTLHVYIDLMNVNIALVEFSNRVHKKGISFIAL